MKYYVFEVSTGDAKIAGRAVYECETENEAIANWHQKLATARKSQLYTSDLCMVLDENGAVIQREKYTKPVETPVEEETVE